MPEHVARIHTQRALHCLLLDDDESAKQYLLRALSSLKPPPVTAGKPKAETP